MKQTVRIPFTVGHIAGMTLAEQIAEGVRNAISTGFYKPGEILPTRRQFAETLRVSERAPREAMALLADEGLVSARRCLGCVISEKGERRWRGRVLFVESGDFLTYFHAAFRASFCRRLVKAGYLVTSVSCPDDPRGEADVSMLELALRQNTDLVVVFQDNREVLRMVEQADVRLMTFSPAADRLKHCDRGYRLDSDAAVKELVAHLERRKIRTVVQVGVAGSEEIVDLRPHLKFTGIRLMSWNIPRCRTRTGVECITYGVQSDFVKRFGLGKGALPDLFFFRDDFAAVGGLSALLASGVRIPEDVRVVSLSNRGNCPVCPRSLARLEIDPVRAGIVCAEQTLATLCPSRFGVPENAAYRYIRGETFP